MTVVASGALAGRRLLPLVRGHRYRAVKVLLLAVLAVAVIRAPIDWAGMAHRLPSAAPLPYVGAVLTFQVAFLLRGRRWRRLLGNAGECGRTLPLTALILASFCVNCVVPARGGDVYRGLMLRRRQGTPLSVALGTVVAEKALDLTVLALLAGLAAAVLLHPKVPLSASTTTTVVGVALAAVLCTLGGGLWWRPVLSRVGRVREATTGFRRGVSSLRPGLRWLCAGTVAIWLLEAGRLGLVVVALGDSSVGVPVIVLTALMASLLSTIPFLPGGLGLVDGGVVYLLVRLAGVGPSEAASIAVLDRSISFGLVVITGGLVAGLLQAAGQRTSARVAEPAAD